MNQGLVFHWISLKPKSVIRVYAPLWRICNPPQQIIRICNPL